MSGDDRGSTIVNDICHARKGLIVPSEFIHYLSGRHPDAESVELVFEMVDNRAYVGYTFDNSGQTIYLFYWVRSTAPPTIKRYIK